MSFANPLKLVCTAEFKYAVWILRGKFSFPDRLWPVVVNLKSFSHISSKTFSWLEFLVENLPTSPQVSMPLSLKSSIVFLISSKIKSLTTRPLWSILPSIKLSSSPQARDSIFKPGPLWIIIPTFSVSSFIRAFVVTVVLRFILFIWDLSYPFKSSSITSKILSSKLCFLCGFFTLLMISLFLIITTSILVPPTSKPMIKTIPPDVIIL